jgi:hypothetical protein
VARGEAVVSAGEQEAMGAKLLDLFPNLWVLTVIFPWCMLEFEGQIWPSSKRPFLIAGLAAVYISEDEDFPLGTSYLGVQGGAQDSHDPEEITRDLYPYHTPS